jgi:predicted dehydrogenase
MAMNAAEARRMWEASKRHPDRVAQLVPSPFTLAFDGTIQRGLAEGAIGSLLAVDVHGAPGSLVDPKAALTWRTDRSLSGLNTLALGIWYEAMARWIGHAKRVIAMTKTCVPQRRDEDGFLQAVEIPDHVDVVAELYCGAQAHLRFSAVTGFCPAPWCVFLYGAGGTIRLDASGGSLSVRRRGEDAFRELPIAEEDRGGWRVEEEFVSAIRGGVPARLTTFAEGVRYMEFTEAVAISAAEGRAVSLPLLD